MSKWPEGLVHIGNIINYLLYLPAPFPMGLEVDLEGSSIFLPLLISLYINRLSFLINCMDAYLIKLLCIKVGGLVL